MQDKDSKNYFGIYNCNYISEVELIIISISKLYADIGDPIYVCQHCNTYMWHLECIGKFHHMINPNFQLCCSNGKVELLMLKTPPNELHQLLFQ